MLANIYGIFAVILISQECISSLVWQTGGVEIQRTDYAEELKNIILDLETKVQTASSKNAQLQNDVQMASEYLQNSIPNIKEKSRDVGNLLHEYKVDAAILNLEQESLSLYHLQQQQTMYVFFAYASVDRNYDGGAKIRFDGIITNAGNGYDVSENQFVCEQDGYYMFHVGLYSNLNRIRARISRSGIGVCTIIAHGSNVASISDATDHGSNVCIMTCGPGQVVEVEAITYTGMTVLGGSFKASTFSGFLLLAQ